MIYYGVNKMAHFQKSLRTIPHYLRVRYDESIPVVSPEVFDKHKFARDHVEQDWKEQAFGFAGALTAASIYSITYPVTWIDGPLPFVDAAWAFGLYRTTKAGYNAGELVGSLFS